MPADTVYRMTFGKHKDKPVTEVPTGYLGWVIKNLRDLDEKSMTAIKAEFATRQDAEPESPPPPPPRVGIPQPEPIVTEMFRSARRRDEWFPLK